MVHDYSFFGSTANFGHLQTTETSGRNMAVELDSRHPRLPKPGWENEDLTLILRGGGKWIFLQIPDTSAFNARS